MVRFMTNALLLAAMSLHVPALIAAEPHAHGHKGPHKGMVLELGADEYHAELVDDHKSNTVTVYLLDGQAKNAVAIDTKEVVINVRKDGKGEQYRLAASPQEGDAAGTASRFSTTDKKLCDRLHGHVDARLRVSINGKSYNAKIPHDHDHEHEHKDGK